MTRIPETELSDDARTAIQSAAPTATSILNSETLGEAVVVAIPGLIISAININNLLQGNGGWLSYVGCAFGLIIIWVAVEMIRSRVKSSVGEFELVSAAFHIRSFGMGQVEVYCWAKCTDVSFTTVRMKGTLYAHTIMKIHFGNEVVEVKDVLSSELRATPAASPLFSSRIELIEQARAAFRNGTYESLPGAKLFPSALP